MPTPTQQPTTQTFLDIFDITNDMIIMSDGAVSIVLTVSAMNFGLLSEDEQDATIYSYAALLNSLSFPVEIVISSQPKDVTTYLHYVQDQEEQTPNQLYKKRLQEYRLFVESLVQEQNVLDKRFYIVIPLSAVEMGLSAQSVVPGAKAKPLNSYEKNFIIEKATTNLFPRRDHVIDQLARIGLYSRQLTTQELIQMLYASYNPESYEGQKVTETISYTTPLVQAQIQGGYIMADQNATPPTTPITTQGVVSDSTPQPVNSMGVTTPAEMSTTTTQQPANTGTAPITPGIAENPILSQSPQPVTPTQPMTPPVIPTPTPQAPISAGGVGQPPSPVTPDVQTTIDQTLGAIGEQPVSGIPNQPAQQ